MKHNRTTKRPLIFTEKPSFRLWNWTVTIYVRSSGYASGIHVTATHPEGEGMMVGSCEMDLAPFDDVWDKVEECSMGAMLGALEQHEHSRANDPSRQRSTSL